MATVEIFPSFMQLFLMATWLRYSWQFASCFAISECDFDDDDNYGGDDSDDDDDFSMKTVMMTM